jgi:type IV secretory pathway VirB6-like protein
MPIYITILEFASEILQVLNNQNPDLSIPGIKVTAQDGSNTLCVPFDHSVAQNGCKITNAENIIFTENSGMPDAPLKMMECLVCSVSDRLSIGYSIAYYLLQMGSLLSVLVGMILIAAFVIAQLCFALYLIDSIFRLNMILLILPILIMAYPFEQTRRWSITGFKIIINSSVIMLCLVVMVVMAILALENILLTGKQNGFDFALKSAYEDFGVVPMTLIFTAFLIVKVSGLAVSLAGRVTNEGGDARFQQKIAALVGTIGQFLLASLGGPLGKGINKVLDKATERSAVLRTTRQKLGQMNDYVKKLAGRLPPQDNAKTGEGEQQ